MLKPKPQPEKPLSERIAEFRAELDRFIDDKVDELKEECSGVPAGVLRNILTQRAGGCQCQAVQNLLEQT
jgi:hypothetical protein